MENIRALEVFFNDEKVGKLAILHSGYCSSRFK